MTARDRSHRPAESAASDRRTGADYDQDDEPTGADAVGAIADAERFVDAVERWLASR